MKVGSLLTSDNSLLDNRIVFNLLKFAVVKEKKKEKKKEENKKKKRGTKWRRSQK